MVQDEGAPSADGTRTADGRGAVQVSHTAAAPVRAGWTHDATGGLADSLLPEPQGRYRVERELARGGQGIVYVAFDAQLGRQVAFKVLPAQPPAAGDLAPAERATTTAARRFVREARITAQLEHAGIAPLHDVGLRADGSLYAAQKLVRGRTLAAALEAGPRLADRLELVRPFLRVCEAVAFAHARGVVHRDLKPANVILGELGEAVVLDWGVARTGAYEADGRQDAASRPDGPGGTGLAVEVRAVDSLLDEPSNATQHGAILGTPAWMSPEQAAGASSHLGPRSDVWALGAMLYEVLTGARPFVAGSVAEVLAAITQGAFVPVAKACPEAPRELAAVAERALRRNPRERYAHAGELAAELAAWLSGGRVAAHEYTTLQLVRKVLARNPVASWLALLSLVAVLATTASFRQRYLEGRRSLAEALLMSASNAARELRWGEAAAYFAASRSQSDGLPARLGLAAALHRAPRPLSDRELPGDLYEIAFGAGGRPLAALGESGCATVRDASTGAVVVRVERADIFAVALAVDGSAMAVASHRTRTEGLVEVVAVPSGERIGTQVLVAPEPGSTLEQYFEFDVSPGGHYFKWWRGASMATAGFSIHRTSDGAEVYAYPGKVAARFSGDGLTLVTLGSGGLPSRVELASGRITRLPHPPLAADQRIGALAAPSTGGALLGTSTGTIVESDLEGAVTWEPEHRAYLSGLRLSADASTLASVSRDGTLVLWNVGARSPRARLELTMTVENFALSADGSRLAVQQGPHAVRVWDLPADEPVTEVGWQRVAAGALSTDGRRLATYSGPLPTSPRVEVFELASGHRVASRLMRSAWDFRQTVALSADGARLAAVGSAHTEVLALEVGQEPRLLCTAGLDRPPVALAPSGAFVVLAASDGKETVLRRFETDHCTPGWRAPLDASSLAFTPDGQRLVVGDVAGRVHLLDAGSGRVLHSWTLAGYLYSVAITPDGQRIAASGESGAWLIDAREGAVRTLDGRSGTPWTIGFSSDGALVVASGTRLTVWSGETGQPVLSLPGDRATSLAGFAGAGRTLYSAGLGVGREEISGDELTPPEAQLAEVLARFKFRMNGQRVVEDLGPPAP